MKNKRYVINNEIKLRAWHLRKKEMVYDVGITHDGWVFDGRDNNINVGALGDNNEDCIVMRDTTLTDDNQDKVYDGDILKRDDGKIGYVKFDLGMFICFGDPLSLWCKNSKIIGNVCENLELLNQG